jgi:hypothetical protein
MTSARMFQPRFSLTTLPLPLKVLATCFLLTMGTGYLFATAYLYLSAVQPHANGGLVKAIVVKYYGDRGSSRLEASLEGSMKEYTTPAERQQIVRWIHEGAGEAQFADVQPILVQACGSCHSAASGMPLAPLTTYREVAAFTEVDLGKSIQALARVSHVHLFGMSFIFLGTGIIFSFTRITLWLRILLIALPFVAIWIDIGSWWFTKHAPLFAYTVIAGGTLMGLSLAAQIIIPLYEMWVPTSRSEPAEKV